jgi:hypothetical protein
MNRTPPVVFSRKLEDVGWANSRSVKGRVVEDVLELTRGRFLDVPGIKRDGDRLPPHRDGIRISTEARPFPGSPLCLVKWH